MRKFLTGITLSSFFAFLLMAAFSFSAFGQTIDFERARHREILDTIKSDVKKYYYDPGFHGVELETRFKTAEERIKKAASIGEMSGIIAQVLIDFNDSHLFFMPPGKASKTDYGWKMQTIGDKCFIVKVEPESDAQAKGLMPGDEVYSIEGYEPTRENLWKMNYFYNVLRPRPSIKMEIIKPDGKKAALELKSKITEGKRIKNFLSDWAEITREEEDAYRKATRQTFYDKFDKTLIWKIPQFALTPEEVDELAGKFKKKESLILDLRGNGGGRIDMLARLLGNFFVEDVKIGDRKERKKSIGEVAKGHGKDAFGGKLIVLIDSDSGSASEVFARVIQLEKRGTILGDQSAGAVMTSIQYPHQVGIDIVAAYAVSVTIADLIMADGKSLEHVGVKPDEKILPTALDLANKRDPVLARALQIAGIEQTPEQAGSLLPKEK